LSYKIWVSIIKLFLEFYFPDLNEYDPEIHTFYESIFNIEIKNLFYKFYQI